MDEYVQADQERRRLRGTPCGQGGVSSGWCVDAGGRQIRNIHRQHRVRYSQARVDRGLLRALLVKARLV